jgi:single-stranded-DNA-specific exonuclease
MKFRWSPAPPQPLACRSTGVATQDFAAAGPMPAQSRLQRTVRHPEFLQPRLKNLADPFLLPNMAAAVERLLRAREQNEPLVIFGDYDVDGVTSTALLLEVLRPLGWRVDFYLPNRMDEGYGLSADGVENCLKKFPTTLLFAVDCGSTAVETIRKLRERGVDTIVLDHHQVSNPAPAAVALVNPQLPSPNSQLPSAFTELCSAGLAFKLAHALVKRGREINLPGAAEFDLRPPCWI